MNINIIEKAFNALEVMLKLNIVSMDLKPKKVKNSMLFWMSKSATINQKE